MGLARCFGRTSLSHRGGAPTNEAATTSHRRSTRPGCEWGWLGVLAGLRFRTVAVLLQMKLPPPRTVGAPAPGANVGWAGSHRGRCSYTQAGIFLHRNRDSPRTVGAPAPAQRRSATSVGPRRWTSVRTRSRASRLPPAAGWLTMAVTAQLWPLLSRVMPAMARTLRRVPVLMW